MLKENAIDMFMIDEIEQFNYWSSLGSVLMD